MSIVYTYFRVYVFINMVYQRADEVDVINESGNKMSHYAEQSYLTCLLHQIVGSFLGHQLNLPVKPIRIGTTTVRTTKVSSRTAVVSKKAV